LKTSKIGSSTVGFCDQFITINSYGKEADELIDFLCLDLQKGTVGHGRAEYDLVVAGTESKFTLFHEEKELYSGTCQYDLAYTLINEILHHCIVDNDKGNVIHAAAIGTENYGVLLPGTSGAGKSTIFKLITGQLTRQDGKVNVDQSAKIAIQKQTMDKKYNELNVREFFEAQFTDDEPIYDIDRRIEKALDAVNFKTPYEKLIKDFSGGQQARLLLASALIQDPDILLLDEPTNNLDAEGIGHLIGFLMMYEKTVLVISHDSDFLNLFTDGVLYLDVHSKTVQKYMGDYYSVVDEIEAQRKREEMKNSRLLKEIQAKKEKANVFAHKGGKLRAVAKRMREVASEAEDNMVEVRKEDKTIFNIPNEFEKSYTIRMSKTEDFTEL